MRMAYSLETSSPDQPMLDDDRTFPKEGGVNCNSNLIKIKLTRRVGLLSINCDFALVTFSRNSSFVNLDMA